MIAKNRSMELVVQKMKVLDIITSPSLDCLVLSSLTFVISQVFACLVVYFPTNQRSV